MSPKKRSTLNSCSSDISLSHTLEDPDVFPGALLALMLCLTDVLPMPLRYVAQTATFSAICPTGPWIMIFGLVGTFMGLLLSPYRPGQQGDVCFIDAACIHQTNTELMQRGIRGIGGFLLVARELRILWSPAYLTRLWCVAWLLEFHDIFAKDFWSSGLVVRSIFYSVRGKSRR